MKAILALLVGIFTATAASGFEPPARQKAFVAKKSAGKRDKSSAKKSQATPREVRQGAEQEAVKQMQASGFRQYQMRLQAESRGMSEYREATKRLASSPHDRTTDKGSD
ncbi:MAG TPA: hypothetical protein DDY22_07225 [Geobacter sp.]|nr:hypothetical protein [Geobacter sp.]